MIWGWGVDGVDGVLLWEPRQWPLQTNLTLVLEYNTKLGRICGWYVDWAQTKYADSAGMVARGHFPKLKTPHLNPGPSNPIPRA